MAVTNATPAHKVTEVIEVTGNQYAKRHATRAIGGSEISAIPHTLSVPSVPAHNAGVRARDPQSPKRDHAGSVA